MFFFFFQAEDGIRDYKVTGVQTCALPICPFGLVLHMDPTAVILARLAAALSDPRGRMRSTVTIKRRPLPDRCCLYHGTAPELRPLRCSAKRKHEWPGTIDLRYRFAVSPKTVNSATPGVMPFGAPRMTRRAALPGVAGHSR